MSQKVASPIVKPEDADPHRAQLGEPSEAEAADSKGDIRIRIYGSVSDYLSPPKASG